MRSCLLIYSLTLFTLGFIIGFALKPSHRPEHRDYPALVEPDNSAADANRHA